jgi:opacity protein-like surface antigen
MTRMRRFLAVAALGVALLSVSACADVDQPKPGSSETPKQTTTLADKKKTCDDYAKVVADFTAKMTPIVAQAGAAQSDPAKGAQLLTDFTTVVQSYQSEAGKVEAAAGDPAVKAAIKAEVDASKKVQADLLASGGDPAKVKVVVDTAPKPGDKVTALCASK